MRAFFGVRLFHLRGKRSFRSLFDIRFSSGLLDFGRQKEVGLEFYFFSFLRTLLPRDSGQRKVRDGLGVSMVLRIGEV